MKRLLILLAAILVTIVVFGENGPSPLITPSSVSGLGTMAVVNSPVPVANGGTGATTAAAGLAALGGASLNGSSTVEFNTKNLTSNGAFTVKPLAGVQQYTVRSTQIASSTSVPLESLIPGMSSQSGRLSVYSGTVGKTGAFRLNTVDTLIVEDLESFLSVTSTTSKLCVIPDGDGTYTVRNGFTGSLTFIFTWMGR